MSVDLFLAWIGGALFCYFSYAALFGVSKHHRESAVITAILWPAMLVLIAIACLSAFVEGIIGRVRSGRKR